MPKCPHCLPRPPLCANITETSFPRYGEHRHSGIGLLTPEVLHYGHADAVIQCRQAVLSGAYERHPERFVRRHPRPPEKPKAVWINPPTTEYKQH